MLVHRKRTAIFRPTISIKNKQHQVGFQSYVGAPKANSDVQTDNPGRLEDRRLVSMHQHNFEIRPKIAYVMSS